MSHLRIVDEFPIELPEDLFGTFEWEMDHGGPSLVTYEQIDLEALRSKCKYWIFDKSKCDAEWKLKLHEIIEEKIHEAFTEWRSQIHICPDQADKSDKYFEPSFPSRDDVIDNMIDFLDETINQEIQKDAGVIFDSKMDGSYWAD